MVMMSSWKSDQVWKFEELSTGFSLERGSVAQRHAETFAAMM